MKQLHHHLAALLLAVWIGGLCATGYLAVPVLFTAQPDRQLAGLLAGEMFTRVSYLSLFCGFYWLLYLVIIEKKQAIKQLAFWLVVGMLLLTLVNQCGIRPQMVALKSLGILQSPYAEQFKMLHGVSSILYLLQSILGGCLLLYVVRLKYMRV